MEDKYTIDDERETRSLINFYNIVEKYRNLYLSEHYKMKYNKLHKLYNNYTKLINKKKTIKKIFDSSDFPEDIIEKVITYSY